jgi:enamine deaminase RidA (YjgF/YER057c/UK114 family)
MSRQNIFPEKLPKRIVSGQVLYAPVVRIENAGSLIFISGLLARDIAGNIVGRGDMGAQLEQVGKNLAVALEAAGASLADLVKTSTYVTDIDEFFRHVDIRTKYFGALPTSTTVEVRRLSDPAFMVEIDAIAVV